MLSISIREQEFFNNYTNEFLTIPPVELELEHSLYSISLWESHFCKPFLSTKEKTVDELKYYIKCMIQNPPENVDLIIDNLSVENENKISEYIEAPMTATWFKKTDDKKSREIVTAEIIYYWMVAQNIPFECQYWHLNRLLTLIRVCSEKNAPKKKMSKRDILRNQAALNASRLAKYNTKG